jgi:spore maturation protein CgeB
MRVVILGLSITSSWGNGHATNFRALVRALGRRGHDVLFLERDMPWYAAHRDCPHPEGARTVLYADVAELRERYVEDVRGADLVIVGSYVPDGQAVGEWVTAAARGVTAFYDIDTPVTVAALDRGECAYLNARVIPRYDLYLSFTGGPLLDLIARHYRARCPVPFHCFVDPEVHAPRQVATRWDLGYLGTYSPDRQPALDALLLEPARRRPELRFVVAGPQYPDDVAWPANVQRIEHLPPAEHPDFYAAQRWTLNITRADMIAAGWSPSVRLFEAGACATPVISDRWAGLEEFFVPGTEIVAAAGPDDVLAVLDDPDPQRAAAVARAARARVLAEHTAEHRVARLEDLVERAAAMGRSA